MAIGYIATGPRGQGSVKNTAKEAAEFYAQRFPTSRKIEVTEVKYSVGPAGTILIELSALVGAKRWTVSPKTIATLPG